MGILRSYEDDVMKEVKIVSGMGSLALVAKGKKATEDDSEYNLLDSEISNDVKALLVSNPNKFFKKNFSRYRNKDRPGGNSSSEKARDKFFKNLGNNEEKKDKKLLGDSGYDCNHFHGKNQFAKGMRA